MLKTGFQDARMSGLQQASIAASKVERVNMVPSLTVILHFCPRGLMGKAPGGATSLGAKALKVPSEADGLTGSADFFILSRMTFMCSSAAFTRGDSVRGAGDRHFHAYTCMLLRAGSDMCVPGPR